MCCYVKGWMGDRLIARRMVSVMRRVRGNTASMGPGEERKIYQKPSFVCLDASYHGWTWKPCVSCTMGRAHEFLRITGSGHCIAFKM